MFNCSLGEQRTTFKNVTSPKLLNGSVSTAKKIKIKVVSKLLWKEIDIYIDI